MALPLALTLLILAPLILGAATLLGSIILLVILMRQDRSIAEGPTEAY